MVKLSREYAKPPGCKHRHVHIVDCVLLQCKVSLQAQEIIHESGHDQRYLNCGASVQSRKALLCYQFVRFKDTKLSDNILQVR